MIAMTDEEKQLYESLIKELHNLPDEMTRAYEEKLTDLVMDSKKSPKVDVLESMIHHEQEDNIKYALFAMCGIYYRRVKDHGKQEHLFSVYEKDFSHHPSYPHYLTLSYVDTGYHENWKEIFELAKRNALYMNNSGAQHLFAEIVAMIFEEEEHFKEKDAQYYHWLNEAIKYINKALIESPNYAKYYCTKGRLFSLNNNFDEAQIYIRLAMEKENSAKKDYTLRIGNYQYYLLKVQSRSDREKLHSTIAGHKEEIRQSINEVTEKADMIDKSLMRNLEYLGIFSGIISFTMGSINIASSLAEKSFVGAASLIVVLFGALIGVFGMFDLIIHGYKKENKITYIIVFIVVILAILGGFKLCYML